MAQMTRSCRHCDALAVAPVVDQSLRNIGVYRRGEETWLVIASPASPAPLPEAELTSVRAFAYAKVPAVAAPEVAAPDVERPSLSATRVLQLVNQVRASGTRCGDKFYGSAPPIQLSATLEGVASEHAVDMAQQDYFEHVDLQGHTPADRVRATGYRERLVGENIAYGPTSADEVVQGWLGSTGHCENIMDPRFVEMGLAKAPGGGSRRGRFWDQVLTQPAK